ncbi:Uncharacterised protein [Achromobacter xylosoxidans]|nr:Uncharacterised protein [Achromobacter xylosoxidans]
MPASPASMVPNGATRSTSPGGTSGIGLRVAIPAPVLGTVGDSVTLPTSSYRRRCGVYTTVLLAPRPLLMSPSADQPRMLPPKVVMTRLWPSRMLPLAYIWMSPAPWVMMPAVDGGATPSTPKTTWPPGAIRWIEPPYSVWMPEPPNSVMSPW